MATVLREGDALKIYMGSVLIVTFDVNDRYNSNHSKRPVTQAVRITSNDLVHDYGTWGGNVRAEFACDLLNRMEISPDRLKVILDEKGWPKTPETDPAQTRMEL